MCPHYNLEKKKDMYDRQLFLKEVRYKYPEFLIVNPLAYYFL